MSRRRRVTRFTSAAALIAVAAVVAGLLPASAGASVQIGYRANDYADGQAMSVVPPGENGLVTSSDALLFETTGQRPAHSQDQLAQYTNLIYGAPSLTDATLSTYYNDESFGVQPADIIKTETPRAGLVIYRDKLDIPHVYANDDALLAFGAGFAQAEDRLFLMDVFRHYGEGTLAQFLGSSCSFEQMDHDQLLLAPYTAAQAKAQVDNLPLEYGAQGQLAKTMIYNYVAGVNSVVAQADTNLGRLPADYAAALQPPTSWNVGDVVAIAGLIGGIFGKGGGGEVANAALYKYLAQKLGAAGGAAAYAQFKRSNDPLAPTTADVPFPYEIPGTIDPSKTALPDSSSLTGGPVGTDPNCNLAKPNVEALSIIAALQDLPKHMSNALVVNADHTASGHPIAVFGPQTGYLAPQILSQLDLHSPDYDASGASFPGTGIVELGRGQDYAWSATSAGTDLIDQVAEKVCNPLGGAPAANGAYYLYKGVCTPMVKETFLETAVPKPGGLVGGGIGAPVQLKHEIYLTRHGVVQGWTTVNGNPVAIVNNRSTYGHDVDSVVGFLGWGEPALTHDAQSWMASAAKIGYTFNWFYVDNRDTAYFVSGLDPVRLPSVDPTLPTWGTGIAEWQGFLPVAQHVHEINPPQGYFVSWNNKPAPRFAAADDQYGYGQVYRSMMLVAQLKAHFASTGNKVTRADVVQAMETAATQDLDGVTVLPLLLQYLQGRPETPGVQAMLTQLSSWIADGAHRRRNQQGDAQYAHAAAVAISDDLVFNLVQAIFDGLLGGAGVGSIGSTGGATSPGYAILPMQWVNTPSSGGANRGSAYDGGYESYLVTVLQQLLGQAPADAFGAPVTTHLCNGGLATCGAALDAALTKTYNALVTANGASADVAGWTESSASAAAKQTMPVFDAIHFQAVGLIAQPAIDWQNRPTFQQVIQFPRHRPRP